MRSAFLPLIGSLILSLSPAMASVKCDPLKYAPSRARNLANSIELDPRIIKQEFEGMSRLIQEDMNGEQVIAISSVTISLGGPRAGDEMVTVRGLTFHKSAIAQGNQGQHTTSASRTPFSYQTSLVKLFRLAGAHKMESIQRQIELVRSYLYSISTESPPILLELSDEYEFNSEISYKLLGRVAEEVIRPRKRSQLSRVNVQSLTIRHGRTVIVAGEFHGREYRGVQRTQPFEILVPLAEVQSIVEQESRNFSRLVRKAGQGKFIGYVSPAQI